MSETPDDQLYTPSSRNTARQEPVVLTWQNPEDTTAQTLTAGSPAAIANDTLQESPLGPPPEYATGLFMWVPQPAETPL